MAREAAAGDRDLHKCQPAPDQPEDDKGERVDLFPHDEADPRGSPD